MKTFIQTTLLCTLTCFCLLCTAYAQTIPDSIAIRSDTAAIQNDSHRNEPFIFVTDSVLDNADPPVRSHFETTMSFQSNDVYLGRKDSTVLPYLIPEISYSHKSGFYLGASLNYLKNATTSRIDLFTIEGGYKFNSGEYDGQFTASKYFYNSQSTSVTSELTAAIDYQNSFDFGFIKPVLELTLNIGSKLDYAALFGLEHSFYLLEDKLDFTPTIVTNASTQNYYSDYYKYRRYTIKSKKLQGQTGIARISGTVIGASTVKILDFEESLPVNYQIGKCTISFTPTYSIPVHPAMVAIQTTKQNGLVTNRTKTENMENSFYWMLGINFLF